MKPTISLIAALFAATAISNAAYTISSSNYFGVSTDLLPIVDNSGTLVGIGTGSAAVGYFGSLSDGAISGSTDFGALLADFQTFGSEVLNPFSDLTGAASDGFFSLSQDDSIPNPGGNAFTGKAIYTLVGNADTLAGSTELAVWKSSTVFGVENELGLGSADSTLRATNGALLLGSSNGPTALNGAASTFTADDGIRLAAAIPEPTSLLLLGLGGLAALIRRRR